MYKLHLILKYLRKRRIAWVSLIAVMLCTTMVLVVISVMGGWLRMFNESFHSISGDVIVHGKSETGFPDYQLMIDKMKQLPEVKAAVPVVRSMGLPISTQGSHIDLTAKSRSFYWIIDDSRTKVSIQDSNTVYLAFDTLQRELGMDGTDDHPARTSDIQVSLKPGVDLEAGRKKIEEAVLEVKNRNIP